MTAFAVSDKPEISDNEIRDNTVPLVKHGCETDRRIPHIGAGIAELDFPRNNGRSEKSISSS